MINDFKMEMISAFEISNLGLMTYCFGMEVYQLMPVSCDSMEVCLVSVQKVEEGKVQLSYMSFDSTMRSCLRQRREMKLKSEIMEIWLEVH